MTTPAQLPLDEPLGVVAGNGELPLALCRSARALGHRNLVVAAMLGDAAPEIETLADHVDWMHPGQLNCAIRCFRRQGVRHVIFIGQITPGRLFSGFRPDWRAMRLMLRLRERNAESIFSAVAAEFERSGLHVLPSTLGLEHYLAGAGLLGRVKPRRAVCQDIDLGRRIARVTSELDIGQTVVVKRGTVLAVEGFEGTDAAIRRGGELGRGGVTVVKVAKPGHDLRFDVPCVGMRTVESLIAAGAKALAVQAGSTFLLSPGTVLSACDQAGIAVVGLVLNEIIDAAG